MHIDIAEGSTHDLALLAPLHYRAGPPATAELILRAASGRSHEETAGVLVVSRPTLNARWRSALWPGEPAGDSPARRAALLNAQLRTISRVIIAQRFRGLGIATRLVRAYLDLPLTERTEAVAAMGAFSGFFRAAGMREVTLAPSRRDRHLRLALRAARIEPWRLVDPRCILKLPARKRDPLDRALRRWANDSRATRASARADLETIIEHAARTVASPFPARAYGYDAT